MNIKGKTIYNIIGTNDLVTVRYSDDFDDYHKIHYKDLALAGTSLSSGDYVLIAFNQVRIAPAHLIIAARLKDELNETGLLNFCETCDGTGETMRMVCYGNEPYEKTDKCPDCNGEGEY